MDPLFSEEEEVVPLVVSKSIRGILLSINEANFCSVESGLRYNLDSLSSTSCCKASTALDGK